jgi:hypothetical protein
VPAVDDIVALAMKIAAALVLVCSLTTNARADEPFHIGSLPKWILLGGVTAGGTVALSDRGALVGGELSLARLRERKYVGFYGDGYYDWGASGTYTTAGLEAGYALLGVDGGAALRFADGGHRFGATGRVSVGLGVVSLFARYAYFPSEEMQKSESVLQVGLLFKLPFSTFGGGY